MSQRPPSAFSRVTGEWNSDSTKGLAHLGAYIAWRRSLKRDRWLKRLIASWILFGLGLACGIASHLMDVSGVPIVEIFFGISALNIFICLIPLLIFSLRLSSRHWWESFLQADFWILSFILFTFLRATFRLDLDGIHWNRPFNPPTLMTSLLVGEIWILWRWLEARRWGASLKSVIPVGVPSIDPALRNYARRLQWIQFAVSLSIVVAYLAAEFAFAQVPIPLRLGLIAMAAGTLPWSRWIFQRLHRSSMHNQWIIGSDDLQSFADLKDKNLLIFHHHGVLSDSHARVEELWIDTSDQWPKEDIREILVHLANQNSHPICELIVKSFPKIKKPLLDLESIQVLPHLGISAQLRDIHKSRVTARLGSVAWHRILQSEMSPEGRARLKSWIERGWTISMLSLNQEVVAAIAIDSSWRADLLESLTAISGDLNFTSVALSSTNRNIPETQYLKQSVSHLFPVERSSHFKRWIERRPKAVEVLAWWDQGFSPTLPKIQFRPTDRLLDQKIEGLLIYGEKLQSLVRLLSSSSDFHGTRKAALGASALAPFCCLSTYALTAYPFAAGFLILSSFFVGGLLWTSRSDLK